MNKLYFCEVSDLPYSIKYMKGYILEKLEKAVFPNNRERISKHDRSLYPSAEVCPYLTLFGKFETSFRMSFICS